MNEVVKREANGIDKVEHFLLESVKTNPDNFATVDCPLVHTFTPGLYSRQVTIPAGCLITSECHRTTHQYVISEGVVEVWTEETGWKVFMAPYRGITEAGTRRVLRTLHDTVWTTFHSNPNDKWKNEDDVYEDIIEKSTNPLIEGGRYKNNQFIPDTEKIK